jgi:IPT/TIG domain
MRRYRRLLVGLSAPAVIVGLALALCGTAQAAAPMRERPVVERLEPGHGPTTGGTVVTITGDWLENVRSVRFGNVPGTILEEECGGMCELIPYTFLKVESPPHRTGMVNVRVTTASGVSPVTSADRYGFSSTETEGPPIELVTGPAEPTSSGYKLKGKLNPDGLPTTYYYEYIGDHEAECQDMEPGRERCWHETAHVGPIIGDIQKKVRPIEVTGLTVGITYRYQLVARNADGTVWGNEASFTVTAEDARRAKS